MIYQRSFRQHRSRHAKPLILIKERGLSHLSNITRSIRAGYAGEFAAGEFEPEPGRES